MQALVPLLLSLQRLFVRLQDELHEQVLALKIHETKDVYADEGPDICFLQTLSTVLRAVNLIANGEVCQKEDVHQCFLEAI